MPLRWRQRSASLLAFAVRAGSTRLFPCSSSYQLFVQYSISSNSSSPFTLPCYDAVSQWEANAQHQHILHHT